MATGPTAVTSVALTNTFDEWRNSTNDLITIINAANSANPESAVVFANSEKSFSANAIVANSIQANVTSSKITGTGANINFTSANVTSLGNVHQTHILGGTTITGGTPDSSISNVQINYAEINLNGANFNANGSSTINLNGATISDLGTVSTVDINGGTIDGCDITITGASGGLTITGGTQDFTGATIQAPTIAGGTIRTLQVHSSNLTVNGTSTLVTNTGTIFGSNNNDAANVGIGTFPEYTEGGSTRTPTSSHGKLHVRQGFATGASSGTQPTANAQSNALVLENETSTGLSIITANDANVAITFGDEDDSDVGQLLYHHANNDLTIRTNAQDKLRVHTASGGSLQIPGANTFGTIGGKLHVNVGSTDATTGIFLDSNDVDQVGISIDGEQTTAHVMRMDVDALTTGSAIFVDDNSASTGARKIVNIVQDHVDATGGKAVFVKTDGMDAVEINQNAAAKVGLNVYSSTAHSTQLVRLVDDGAATAETLFVRSDATSTTTKVVTVANSSADMVTVIANGFIGIGDNTPTHKLDVNGSGRFTGAVTLDTTLAVTRATTLSNTLSVTGATTLSNTFSVANNATVTGTLGVTRATTLANTISVTGATTLSNTLSVTGATTLSNTFSVANNATVTGTLGVTRATTLSNTLSVTGATTVANTLSVTGATSLSNTFSVANNATVTGTLGVTRATSLANTISVTGAATLSNTISVTGAATLSNTISVTGAATFSNTASIENITDTSSKTTGALVVTGGVGIGKKLHVGTTITEDSALALKENLSIIKDPLEKINRLRGVNFDWKDKREDKRQLGLIAEDVKWAVPEAEYNGSVSYTKLVGLLVEGIKDLSKEVNELKAKING